MITLTSLFAQLNISVQAIMTADGGAIAEQKDWYAIGMLSAIEVN
jgi:hypothetical protein